MGGEFGADLPASLAAAWGVHHRPSRGPKPGLSLERIVSAAVRVAGSEGLAAVSMSRVAAELGTGPMSLYRYVAGKDELLALMVDAAHGPPPAGPAPDGPPAGEDWRAGLTRWSWAIRAGYQRHPWVLQVPIRGLPSLPNEVAWFEEGLRCLAGTGLAEAAKGSVILLVTGHVRNAATIDTDIEAAIRASGQTPDEWMSSYARTITRLAAPQQFPALTKFIAAGVFDRADPPDTEFSFGLERILDGIAALVHAGP